MRGLGEMNLPPETQMKPALYQNDTGIPSLKMELPPPEMVGQLPLPKPRRKRQRRAEKPPKAPTEKKKRGRKPKMEKLMAQAAADAIHAGLAMPPSGEWGRVNNSRLFMTHEEMMNGPQGHPEAMMVNDVNMRRASLENMPEVLTLYQKYVALINLRC